MNTRNLRAKYGAKLAVVASSVIAAGQALAQTAPTTGVEAVEASLDHWDMRTGRNTTEEAAEMMGV